MWQALEGVSVINRLNITDYIVKDGRILGTVGFNIDDGYAYEIRAKKVLCATGGAAGLYKPNNPGFSRHKMWYPPFNTGAGYAMGINAGAEMTTFEMRFIALRCKDTIAPTGTIAQGVGAKQVNSKGEVYEDKYGLTTSQRVYGTVRENIAGRGPCYLRTEGISREQDESLKKAYLNMAPSQTLKWIESGKNPSEQNVEIEGTEPYIVGGHTASGYWVDTNRRTTIDGLYAAGDVAGGCPQKYVTGAMAEGEIAAIDIVKALKEEAELTDTFSSQDAAYGCHDIKDDYKALESFAEEFVNKKLLEYNAYLERQDEVFSTEQLEEAMQKVMDTYAGGIGSHYQFNEKQLELARQKIAQIITLSGNVSAADYHGLMFVYELKERLTVCQVLIEHLKARKETRWHSFAENLDYPDKSDEWLKYVNTRKNGDNIEVIFRNLVGMEFGGGVVLEADAENCIGFTGAGYLNFPLAGGYAIWKNVDGKNGGRKTIRLRYANGKSQVATPSLIVNGVQKRLRLPSTDSWDTYQYVEVAAELKPGTDNVIRLESSWDGAGHVAEFQLMEE